MTLAGSFHLQVLLFHTLDLSGVQSPFLMATSAVRDRERNVVLASASVLKGRVRSHRTVLILTDQDCAVSLQMRTSTVF